MSDASPPIPPAVPELLELLGMFLRFIAGLHKLVAAHYATDRNAVPWIVLVCGRIQRAGKEFARLYARYRAGTLPKPRRRYRLTKPRAPAKRPPLVLPNHGFWLSATVAGSGWYGSYLRQVLDHPEFPAFLAAAPQLYRVLLPLCLMLGVEPPPRPERPDLEPLPEASPLPEALAEAAPALACETAVPPKRRTRRSPVRRWPWPASWPPAYLNTA